MKLSEVVKKIRLENELKFSEMGHRLGFTKSMIDAVEKGRAPVSKKFLESLLIAFPFYESEIIEGYINQFLPNDFKITEYEIENEEREISSKSLNLWSSGREEAKKYELKVFEFVSGGNGEVVLDKYTKEEFVFEKSEAEKIIKDGHIFRVLGDSMKPYFFDNDVIIFKKEEKIWEELDGKLLLIKMKSKHYIRKLFFESGVAYLHSFNERVYPKMKLEEESELIGVLYLQVKRELTNINF